MKRKFFTLLLLLFYIFPIASCNNLIYNEAENNDENRIYNSYYYPFESVSEFDGFYIMPQNYMNSCSHDLSVEQVYKGTYAHKAWVYAPNPDSTLLKNNNHRAYPTLQFYKTAKGSVITPCYITLYVWLDFALEARRFENQWFSFATLCTDDSDNWSRVIGINLSYQNIVHLMHTPYQGDQEWVYQTTTETFPMKEWVKLTIFIDTTPFKGYVKVWQNDSLVSQANIADGDGSIDQMHFGLYSAPSVSSGICYNDELTIREVEKE